MSYTRGYILGLVLLSLPTFLISSASAYYHSELLQETLFGFVQDGRLYQETLFGFVQDGRLYTTEIELGTKRAVFDDAILNSIPLSKGAGRGGVHNEAVVRYKVENGLSKNAHFRWRISHNCFWGTGDFVTYKINSLKCIPLNELEFFDTKMVFGEALYRRKHPKNPDWYFDAVKATAYAAFKDHYGVDDLNTLGIGVDPSQSPIHGPIYFDFLPTSEMSFLLFVWWKGQIHIWYAQAKKSKEQYVEFDIQCTEDKSELFAVNFKERFQVFGKDRTYYFVTQSGKLYCSPKPAGKGKRGAAALWEDEKSPIRAVIADTKSERTFAFTEPAKKDAKGGQRVYFELAEKIETERYERMPVDGITEPLKTVMEYAQVLVKDKKIK